MFHLTINFPNSDPDICNHLINLTIVFPIVLHAIAEFLGVLLLETAQLDLRDLIGPRFELTSLKLILLLVTDPLDALLTDYPLNIFKSLHFVSETPLRYATN